MVFVTMKNVFSKLDFPKAPGGDLYEWTEVETSFEAETGGLYVIKIAARAKNAKQNKSTDDDDLRIALDGFHFGKYERRKDKISWKGYGTSAAWNGANLKGGTKTIYYFVELDGGEHRIQFFADGQPYIVGMEVFQMDGLHFELNDLSPEENIENSSKGIPWISFVFLGSKIKSMLLDVETKSAKEKGGTDGDNLKIVVNGRTLKNPKAPNSKKYQNFYFSGNVHQEPVVTIDSDELANPLAFENAVEIWYDQEPRIVNLQIDYFDEEAFLEKYNSFDFDDKVFYFLDKSFYAFRKSGKIYSERFLEHSLTDNPEALSFGNSHTFTKNIKDDPAYDKILTKIKERIKKGILEGELWPKDFDNNSIYFNSEDLSTAIHGIIKIEYSATLRSEGSFNVDIVIFDIYDFLRADLPGILSKDLAYFKQLVVNAADFGERIGLVNNFEIKINAKEVVIID